MSHTFLTVAIPFNQDRTRAVNALIEAKGKLVLLDAQKTPGSQEQTANKGPIYKKLEDSEIHFLSLTAIDAYNQKAYLIIESSHDGKLDSALDTVAEKLEAELEEICDAAEIRIQGSLRHFLEENVIKTGQSYFQAAGLDHAGLPGMSVKRIKREHDQAEKIRTLVASRPAEERPA